ncbi:MAG: ABC transporter substrate-binding protein [Planctomycetota bacterium]|jgi:branched-chain amino acid transport system substrate-binding protein
MQVAVRKAGRARLVFLAITLSGILLFFWLTTGCQREKKPIKIGFVGGLTGRHASLGLSGKNGVILATEEINQAGGVGGRPVELISKNDMSNPEIALRVDTQLIEEGVVAIIGHMTSATSVVAVPMINRMKMHMISPTTTTNQLMGIDDYFFRIQPSDKELIVAYATHAFRTMGLRKMVVVGDNSNEAYTKAWIHLFESEFEKLVGFGEGVISEIFVTGSHIDFSNFSARILAHEPEGVLLVAGPEDSATLCSILRKRNPELRILCSPWAMNQDFIENGGIAVEGVLLSDSYDTSSQAPGFADFQKRFKNRFGVKPNRASMSGYEAAGVLFTALSANNDPTRLGETIVKLKTFRGIQGRITIDENGDAHRELYPITVQGGKFVRLADN